MRRPLPVHHDQARPVSVGQPLQRVAPGPHPLLAAGARVHAASGHADVLPGRPVLPVRPDLQLGARRSRPRAHDLDFSIHEHPARTGRRPTTSTSTCAARRRRRSRRRDDFQDNPLADGRAVLRDRAAVAGGPSVVPEAPRVRSGSPARSTTAPAGDSRPPDRDLAGRSRRALRRHPRPRRRLGARGLPRLRPLRRGGRRRQLSDAHRQARPGPGPTTGRCRHPTSTSR